jgi:hypothetical protein
MKINFWLCVSLLMMGIEAGAQGSATDRPLASKKKAKPEQQGICLVADFRNLALTVHDPKLRQDAVINWLKNHTETCSVDQLNMINRYRAVWLGTSDNPKVVGIIDSLIELKSSGDPQKLQDIFGSQVSSFSANDPVVVTAKPNPVNVVYQLVSPPPAAPDNGATGSPGSMYWPNTASPANSPSAAPSQVPMTR